MYLAKCPCGTLVPIVRLDDIVTCPSCLKRIRPRIKRAEEAPTQRQDFDTLVAEDSGKRLRLILVGILSVVTLIGSVLFVSLRRTGSVDRAEVPSATSPDTKGASLASPTQKPATEPQAKNSYAANTNNAAQRSPFAGIEDLLEDRPGNANRAAQGTVPKSDDKVGQIRPPPSAALPNGTELVPRSGREGLGTLSIENGNSLDAVVKLIHGANTQRTLRCVYIRGNSSVRLNGIPEGDYRVMFTLGTDWDRVQMEFRRDAVYEEFIESLNYHEVEESDGIKYSDYRLTLHKVTHGNAPSRSISRDRFGVAIPEPRD